MTFRRFDEIDDYRPGGHAGVLNRLLAGASLGDGEGVSVWHGKFDPGGHSEIHRHPGSIQVYVGVSGEFVVGIGGEESTIGPRDVAVIPAGTEHFIANRSDSDAEVLVVSSPALR